MVASNPADHEGAAASSTIDHGMPPGRPERASPGLDPVSHRDSGAIRLALLLDARTAPEVVSALHHLTQARIASKVATGDGQVFEEGPVYLQARPRVSAFGDIGRACLYQMEFGDPADTPCARMHTHPLGERFLIITPVTAFFIWSLTPFEIDADLVPMSRILSESECSQTGRRIHGVEVSANVAFTAQIPAGTTHRFLGRATGISVHPDEAAELAMEGSVQSSMEAQTRFWTAVSGDDCEFPSDA